MKTLKTLTGTVSAQCGCIGVVRDEGTVLTGQFPIVSIRVTIPCQTGHPGRVAAGVTERFAPGQVSQA